MDQAAVIATSRRDFKVIGLVSGAHFFSHAYTIVLPPLFPLLKEEFGVSYAALGFVLTAFAIASGIGQTPVGFLVDRIGGRWLLIWGLTLMAAAIGAVGLVYSYWALLGLYIVAGIANTVFHPADYAILSASVDRGRLGRAFGIHTFAGNVGWAVMPVVMVVLTAWFDWRIATILIGVAGVICASLLWSQSTILNDEKPAAAKPAAATGGHGDGTDAVKGGISLLLSPPILMAFLFFLLISAGTGGLRTFLVAALVAVDQMPLDFANGALTGFLVGGAVGILAGGVAADRLGRPERTAVIGFILTALFIALAGLPSLPFVAIVATLTTAGFFSGMVQPNRDLLVRAVTPEGQAGKVFGFVSTGLSIGGAFIPPIFGWIMDNSDPRWVFWIAAAIVLANVLTVGGLSRAGRRRA
ncbi:MAG: MFS transporter [Alphaproteobacteria bacterium]|nr:MFS transporter [Alphaproteobacteria bacterium]